MKNLIKLWAILFALVMAACQDDGGEPNNPSSTFCAPVLKTPATGATDVSLTPTFTWETSGEDATYDVSLSNDEGETWTIVADDLAVTTCTLTEEQKLDHETTYEWKVTARQDGKSEESSIFSFTTIAASEEPSYYDGKAYLYLDSEKSTPFTLVVTGDGFVLEDYDSGFFDEKVDALMDMFFQVEPYKAYKEYFRVYKLVAISKDRGISVDGYRPEAPPARPALNERVADTRFGISMSEGSGSGMSIPRGKEAGRESAIDRIYDIITPYIPGMTNPAMAENTIILMLANINAYGGTNYSSYINGKAIAITPLTASGVAGKNTYVNLMLHETGHAIGKLGDEYHPSSGGMSAAVVDIILSTRNGDPWRFCANIDLSGDRTKALWAKYYGMPGYENVDYIEGAGGTTGFRGAWRSTQESLMKSDYTSLWFNTISREAIVRQIIKVAGETFDWDEFLNKDVNAPTIKTTAPNQTMYSPLVNTMIWE